MLELQFLLVKRAWSELISKLGGFYLKNNDILAMNKTHVFLRRYTAFSVGNIVAPFLGKGCQLIEVEIHKHFGVYISAECTWHQHIDDIKEKASGRINVTRKLKYKLDRKSLKIIYTAFIRPRFEYADLIWDNCIPCEKKKFDKIQAKLSNCIWNHKTHILWLSK